MSKGSKVVPVRIPRLLLQQIELCILQRNEFSKGEPWVVGTFIRAAIAEKLDKMERSRRGRDKKQTKSPETNGEGS